MFAPEGTVSPPSAEPGVAKRRSDVGAAVVRSDEIGQLLWRREIDDTTGRAAGAADVISKHGGWFAASGVPDGLLLRSPFRHSPFPALPAQPGMWDGCLSVREYCCRDGNAMCRRAT